jgi:hypothetical protein
MSETKMSEEAAALEEAPEIEEATPEAPETPEVDPEVITQASAMGWAPEDQWRGDPSRWVDAQTFLDRGKNRIPILNERIKHQAEQLNEMQATLAQFAEHYGTVQKNAYERAIRDLKAMQQEAVADGDTAKFSQVDQQIEHLRQNPPSAPNIRPPDPSQDPVFQEWLSDNPWYSTDKELGTYAESVGNFIRQRNPSLVGGDFLSEVSKEVRERFPDKFGGKARPVPTVEGARASTPKPKTGKSYSDLPAEAKQACDRFVKQKLLTREQYIKDYFGA